MQEDMLKAIEEGPWYKIGDGYYAVQLVHEYMDMHDLSFDEVKLQLLKLQSGEIINE